jgi:hypothetical protein
MESHCYYAAESSPTRAQDLLQTHSLHGIISEDWLLNSEYLWRLTAGQSQSHITTDDQPVSESWFRAPSGAHDQMLITVCQSQSHIMADDQSVSASWFRAPSGAHDQILILCDSYCFVDIGPPLWREVGSVIWFSHLNCFSSVNLLLAPSSIPGPLLSEWVSEWITTDGQSVCLFWCRAPSGAHDQILITIWLLLFFFVFFFLRQ